MIDLYNLFGLLIGLWIAVFFACVPTNLISRKAWNFYPQHIQGTLYKIFVKTWYWIEKDELFFFSHLQQWIYS